MDSMGISCFFDFEDKCQAKLNNLQKTDVILTFLQKLQEAGYYTGYYTFLNWQKIAWIWTDLVDINYGLHIGIKTVVAIGLMEFGNIQVKAVFPE